MCLEKEFFFEFLKSVLVLLTVFVFLATQDMFLTRELIVRGILANKVSLTTTFLMLASIFIGSWEETLSTILPKSSFVSQSFVLKIK